VMLGALFLGEQIHPTTGVALALILGSVAMNQWAQQRRVQREATLCQAS
jgi:drug/metabolite transporter (DMT)-like permease